MAENNKYSRFSNLTFEHFRRMAADETLSRYEKVGFPDEYRQGKEPLIFQDLSIKMPALSQRDSLILDIGAGCSDLPRLLIQNAEGLDQKLFMIDSEEMLKLLPESKNVEKVAAYYPRCDDLFQKYAGKVNAIIVYSVIQYVFVEGNIFEFLDKSLSLLAPGGQLLIGDIPNISKRKRFFSSPAGIRFHQKFTGTDEIPQVEFNRLDENQIDDSVVLSLLSRARNQGFNAYIMPQLPSLPMANRREDILIVRD